MLQCEIVFIKFYKCFVAFQKFGPAVPMKVNVNTLKFRYEKPRLKHFIYLAGSFAAYFTLFIFVLTSLRSMIFSSSTSSTFPTILEGVLLSFYINVNLVVISLNHLILFKGPLFCDVINCIAKSLSDFRKSGTMHNRSLNV